MIPDGPQQGLRRRLAEAWRNRAIALKATSFALVGVVNFAVDFSIFSFAYLYLEWPIIAANVVAWMIAVSGSHALPVPTPVTTARVTAVPEAPSLSVTVTVIVNVPLWL